jgi:hypothetical protein
MMNFAALIESLPPSYKALLVPGGSIVGGQSQMSDGSVFVIKTGIPWQGVSTEMRMSEITRLHRLRTRLAREHPTLLV